MAQQPWTEERFLRCMDRAKGGTRHSEEKAEWDGARLYAKKHGKLAEWHSATRGGRRVTRCLEHIWVKGIRRHALSSAFYGMWERCTNPDCDNFQWYGEKGVLVCDRWRCFWCFVEDVGARPEGHSLDRKDERKGYEPDNCVWLPADQNANENHVAKGYKRERDGARERLAAYVQVFGEVF